jgi:hypothetical protein
VITLPTRTDSDYYDFEIELDGRSYVLTFNWNGRDSSWYFSIADNAGTPLLSGRKLALGAPFLRRFADARLPPGELRLFDTTGKDVEAGRNDLGSRVLLVYVPAAELAALRASVQ